LASKPGAESATIVDSLGRGGQWILILCECALAIWFFSSRGLIAGSIVSTAILSCFTAVLICELYKPIPRDCGCFGHAAVVSDFQAIRMSLHWGVARNIGLMAGCGIVALSRSSREGKRVAT